MTDKKQYYKLDDIGFVGTQKENKSASSDNYHRKKTGEIFRQNRSNTSSRPSRRLRRTA